MANQLEPGASLGKYRILSHVATGGMGTVYKALDEALDRVVALKVLSPEMTANPILLERFHREARHAARLNHRNIVALYDFNKDDGLYYLALEFVQGIDLADHIARRGKLNPEEARRMLIQAAKALDHAFGQGITHRDIKPSNFLLCREGDRLVVKLTDLGLARTVNEEEFRVTRAGTTVGTVDYMAPEQARDSDLADVRSDIYSLGCTLYHMLAGQPPFAEGGLGERVYKHLAVDPTDVREVSPEVPAGLWFVLQRMLAKAPEDRYQTPAELSEALKNLPDSAPNVREAPAIEAPEARPKPAPRSPARRAARPPTPPPAPAKPARASESAPSRPREGPPASTPAHPKRRSTVPEIGLPADAVPAQLGLSAEQVQAAAGQFERAGEVLRESGPTDYVLQLLLSCCALDPTNLRYRQTLREATRAAGGKRGGWLGALSPGTLAARGKLKAARRAGDHLKVLQVGEKYLARAPADAGAQADMAESAEALGLMTLAVWLLEQARTHDSTVRALRTLARLYEKLHRYPQAIVAWQAVHKAHPTDNEATNKVRELSVTETIARGNYRGAVKGDEE